MKEFICTLLAQSGDFLNILGMVGMALLTILIPIAIAIFNSTKDFVVLDKNVILDHVVNARLFLVYLALIFLPLLFWTSSPFLFRFLELIIWGIGIYFVANVLRKLYYWMKGNKFDFRFNYLKNLKDKKDIEESWKSVWQTININTQNEEEFFIIFSSVIDDLLKKMKEDLKIASNLLEDFNNFVDNRSTIFLVDRREFFPKLLKWHYSIWEKEDQPSHERNSYSEISQSLDSILEKVEKRALKEKKHSSLFFKRFVAHVEKYKEKFIEDKENKKFYVESIIPIFYTTFTENIKTSPEKYNIWNRYFPAVWKITKDNIQKQENYVSRALLKNFLQWAQSRLQCSTEINKFDEVLDEVASNLFPSVDPILWANLLTLLMRPWTDDNRMKSLVEQCPNFGFASIRIVDFYKSEEKTSNEQMKSQKDLTLELVLSLPNYKHEFTKEKLQRHIDNLKKLKYNEETPEEDRRKYFIAIFEEMISLLEPKKL